MAMGNNHHSTIQYTIIHIDSRALYLTDYTKAKPKQPNNKNQSIENEYIVYWNDLANNKASNSNELKVGQQLYTTSLYRELCKKPSSKMQVVQQLLF